MPRARQKVFDKLAQQMIITLPVTKEYPQTDKGTVIRARVYEDFALEISALYERLGKSGEGTSRPEIEDLRRWLLHIFKERLDIPLRDTEEDFFAAGVGSLQAACMLNIIKGEFFSEQKEPEHGCRVRVPES